MNAQALPPNKEPSRTLSTFAPSRPEPRVASAAAALPDAAPRWQIPLLLLFWAVIYALSLAAPPLLDDADATHAQAAQAILRTGDWVTLHVDGIRYLEKAPLPYWMAACSLRLFGQNAFAIHLPLALAVLGLAALGYHWASRSFDPQTAFYTALFILTSVGPFLFTRIFIPDALLSLLLACALYAFQRALEPSAVAILPSPRDRHPERSAGSASPSQQRTFAGSGTRSYALLFWLAMALAVLTKGLIAIVFLLGTAALFFTLTRSWHRWRALRPLVGTLLFVAVAAPWHILAGLRNTQGGGGHGFFWFYFINEHVLRFLGRRTPRDYNKLPSLLYWALHLVWLFPWSCFSPVAAVLLWRKRRGFFVVQSRAQQTFLLLTCFSALVLIFFSLSTNQEYYTFPIYLPVLMLLAAALRRAQSDTRESDGIALSAAKDLRRSAAANTPPGPRALSHDRALARALRVSYGTLALTGGILSIALVCGLWQARGLPFAPDIGTLLYRRGIGGYTMALSHFFDLTGASFAALRLPASLAALALCVGPCAAWLLDRRRAGQAAVLTIAAASALFLLAAHSALCRFAPMLSSSAFARTILRLENQGRLAPQTQVLLLGDQAFGSSIPFYQQRPVELVDGRSTSMLFGSTFPDVPPIFVSSNDLADNWGHGPRKLLFVPAEQRAAADRLLGSRAIVLLQSSGKELLTDRPLDNPAR